MSEKKERSLSFDLLFDLSLLTFCALILSLGLFVMILRSEFFNSMRSVAMTYLPSVHEAFVDSEPYQQVRFTQKGTIKERLESAFLEFTQNLQGGTASSSLRFEYIEKPLPFSNGQVLEQREKFLFFFSTVKEFDYVQESDGAYFIYRWSLDPLQAVLTQLKWRIFLMAILVGAVLVALGYWLLFRRNILIPLAELSRVARSFLAENWSARYAGERRDELGRVGEALNQMAQNIQEKERKLVLTIESLRRANEEIEAAQNEQLQIEKLASIGRLAAGVAHEVGNPLGAISGYIDILRRSMKTGGITAEDLELCDRIEAETNRISKIIRALLNQARPPKERIQPVKIKPILVRSLQLAKIPAEIDIIFELEDDEAEVMAEQDQLVQVFLNLMMNAKHAIESHTVRKEKGRLKIRCGLRKLPLYRSPADSPQEYDTSVVRALKPETYWVVSIEDNGTGISEADQKKLFEPFFSTKAPGKGTGLGLYVTKSIVESFRGAIVVRSAEGYGASFSVFLPRGRALGPDEITV